MAIKLMNSRQVGATTANLIADEIRLGTRYKEVAERSEYYRGHRVNRVIGETIRACNSALGMGGNFKNGCLYREEGLSEFWRKGNGESVVCDHAVPISELINRYKDGEPLERLAFSPVVRISTAANEVLTRAGYAKKGSKAGLPLYRYSLIGLAIVTHDGALVDPATWTDDDHWKLVMSTAELRPVLSALGMFHQSGSEIAETQNVSSTEPKARYY